MSEVDPANQPDVRAAPESPPAGDERDGAALARLTRAPTQPIASDAAAAALSASSQPVQARRRDLRGQALETLGLLLVAVLLVGGSLGAGVLLLTQTGAISSSSRAVASAPARPATTATGAATPSPTSTGGATNAPNAPARPGATATTGATTGTTAGVTPAPPAPTSTATPIPGQFSVQPPTQSQRCSDKPLPSFTLTLDNTHNSSPVTWSISLQSDNGVPWGTVSQGSGYIGANGLAMVTIQPNQDLCPAKATKTYSATITYTGASGSPATITDIVFS